MEIHPTVGRNNDPAPGRSQDGFEILNGAISFALSRLSKRNRALPRDESLPAPKNAVQPGSPGEGGIRFRAGRAGNKDKLLLPNGPAGGHRPRTAGEKINPPDRHSGAEPGK